jgi:hypothetical protein
LAFLNIIEMEENENPGGLNIELNEKTSKGKYTNLAIITHSPTEFIIDYAVMLPGLSKAKVISRMIMTPDKAKSLLKALSENVKKYESSFGEIKDFQGTKIPMNFGGPKGKA